VEDPVRTTLQGLAFAAAAAIVGILGYWMLAPGSGPDELKQMREALRNSRSLKLEFVGTAGDPMQMTGEIACPRAHLIVRRTGRAAGEPFAYQEFLVMEDARYYRESPDAAWRPAEEAWDLENFCVQMQNGGASPRFMPSVQTLLMTNGARIESGDRKQMQGNECRVWRVQHLLKAEDYKNEELCIGTKDHLLWERVTSTGRFLYSGWNELIEVLPPDRIVQPPQNPW